MKKLKFLFFIVITIFTLSSISCKKDDDDVIPPGDNTPAPTGTVTMHLHTYLDLDEVDAYNIVYTNTSGRKISLSLAQLYISGIQLVRPDGSTYDLSAKVLKVFETETYLLGTAPAGNYKAIKFKVGLDAQTNALNSSADSVLLNHSEMWLNSTPQPDGYSFMSLEGKIDTTADVSATVAQMQPFAYKIGTNAHYIQVTMPDQPFTVDADQAHFLHVLIDYNRLFYGVQLNQPANLSVQSAADNATTQGNIIANNISSMFIYE